MCVMGVDTAFTTTAMIEAIAHNLHTSVGDFQLVRPILEARGCDMSGIDAAANRAHEAYALMLAEFGIEVGKVAQDHEGHIHSESDEKHIDGHMHTHAPIGSETDVFAEIARSTQEAHEYETR